MNTKQNTIGVYAHIPYCASKCLYCDFPSVAGAVPDGRYVATLLKELDSVPDSVKARAGATLSSIYIGGGTPSLMTPDAVKTLVNGIKRRFVSDEKIEVTLEANPDSIDRKKLDGYLEAGVNRLSIGIQSFNDATLRAIGRRHNAAQAANAFEAARAAGFSNIGVDLMFGIPAFGEYAGQEMAEWVETLDKALALRPEHLSIYGLTIEDGTPLHGIALLRPKTDDEQATMYEYAIGRLISTGFAHYEISNLSLPGFESTHNKNYWLGRDYIGLGAGAHSYLSPGLNHGWGRRWWNTPSPDDYLGKIESGASAVAGNESLTRQQAIIEATMLGLRMLDSGINADVFKDRFGQWPLEALDGAAMLEREGLLRFTACPRMYLSVDGHRGHGKDSNIALTQKGVLLSNEVFKALCC
ncbi:MAG: radical SAM family heme chaperone HemW [Deltaproteobacteria bacterium]